MICEIDDALIKAKAQLEYLEDKELIDDAMETNSRTNDSRKVNEVKCIKRKGIMDSGRLYI